MITYRELMAEKRRLEAKVAPFELSPVTEADRDVGDLEDQIKALEELRDLTKILERMEGEAGDMLCYAVRNAVRQALESGCFLTGQIESLISGELQFGEFAHEVEDEYGRLMLPPGRP